MRVVYEWIKEWFQMQPRAPSGSSFCDVIFPPSSSRFSRTGSTSLDLLIFGRSGVKYQPQPHLLTHSTAGFYHSASNQLAIDCHPHQWATPDNKPDYIMSETSCSEWPTELISEQTVNRKSAEPAENENKKTLVIRYGLILYLYQALTLFRLMSGSIGLNEVF